MSIFDGLNENQQKAVDWNEGPLLVLAGPGSGKTKTLAARVGRIIKQSPNETFRILCLTFTRKAAAEMRHRLYEDVPEAKGRVLLTTFHSFATDILRQHGSSEGFSPDFEIIDDKARFSIVKEILSAGDEGFSSIYSAEQALKVLDFFLQNLVSPEDIYKSIENTDVAEGFKDLFEKYIAQLKEQNALDYGSILYFCEAIIRTRSRLGNQLASAYKYICVDEFQDTNYAQYSLLKSIYSSPSANLFIVGDDDQLIYQWNGASSQRINELSKNYQLSIIQLPENYRCPSYVVSMANKLIRNNTDRLENKSDLLSVKADFNGSSSVNLYSFENHEREYEGVSELIKASLSSGANASDIVVLARTTKLLDGIYQALVTHKVNAHLQKRKSDFESPPFRLIVSLLKLQVVKSDAEILSTVTKSLSDCVEIDLLPEKIMAVSSETNGDYIEALILFLSVQNSIPQVLVESLRKLNTLDFTEFINLLTSYFDSINDVNEGRERFAEYSTEKRIWKSILGEIGDVDEIRSLSIAQFLQEIMLANKTPEPPSNAVRCMTIHSSKGLEFRHVYLIGLAEDQLPSFQSRRAGDGSREMQEERRNCFVAITRTIETLTMSYARNYFGWPKQPSRFLREMELI